MQAGSFRRLALLAWLMQALIVVSGAAVRLTEAGLGCEDWPTCNDDQILPEWQLHGLIEFGNRVISGFVALSALAVLVGAYRRRPRRSDLIGYAWAVMAGTMLQVVLGGLTVRLDLHPIIVSVHFLVSMALLWAAQVLWFRAGGDGAPSLERAEGAGASGRGLLDRRLVQAQVGLAALVLLTGTVVTGSGPNSGDSRADRLDLNLETVARVHSAFVWMLVATLVVLAVRTARRPNTTSSPPFVVFRWLVALVAAQGAIGYTQFALGVPPLLVELHVIGAISVWSLSLLFYLYVERERQAEMPEWSHEYAS